MPYLRVVYKNQEHPFDYVSSGVLDTLIMREEISHFYRPSEKRWINVKLDFIRGTGGKYNGPERRRHAVPQEKTSNLERKENYPRWLERLCRYLEGMAVLIFI